MRPSASILLLLSGTAFFLVGGVQFALSPHVARAQGQGERPLLDGRAGKPTIPPTLIALPGEFAIETVHPGIYDGFYLTAVGGGGQTTDVIHTDAKQIRSGKDSGSRVTQTAASMPSRQPPATTLRQLMEEAALMMSSTQTLRRSTLGRSLGCGMHLPRLFTLICISLPSRPLAGIT